MTPHPGVAPRRAAWQILRQVRDGVPFDQALDHALEDLDGPDRGLAHELAAGTLRTAGALDTTLAPLVARGLDRVDDDLRDLLRLGAYQLTALDRIPPHAAVSTSVDLARSTAGERAAGFVNAVLRRVASEGGRVVPGRGTHPGWLVTRWTSRFGASDAARLMAWNDSPPPWAVQPARWSAERLRDEWRKAGVPFQPAPHGAGLVPDISRPTDLPGFTEGGFVVQDPAQAMVIRYFAIPAGALVWDACAAPGGKAILVGQTARRVVASDARLSRARRLRENLARAGSGREHAVVADAAAPPVRAVDAVLLDVPCLGTGVLARHPEARWRARPEAITRLAGQAAEFLRAAAGVVRPGGLLCFSTCSLEPEENVLQIEAFLAADQRFLRDPGPAPPGLLTPEGDFETLPHRDGMDGAWAARLRRKE